MKAYKFANLTVRPFPTVADLNNPRIFGGIQVIINVSGHHADVLSVWQRVRRGSAGNHHNSYFCSPDAGEVIIVPEDEGQVARVSDGALWRPTMAEYVAFACLVNPHFPQGRFDELFAGAAAYYWAHSSSMHFFL